jgi:hypothetical protein
MIHEMRISGHISEVVMLYSWVNALAEHAWRHTRRRKATLEEVCGGFDAATHTAQRATGLYCGEQDLFCFLIDPAGWPGK